MSNIGKKRLETVLAIAKYSIGSGTATAAPTPGGEIPKQVVLTASDGLSTRVFGRFILKKIY